MTDPTDRLLTEVPDRVRRTVLEAIRAIATWIGMPLLVFFVGQQVAAGHGEPFLFAELIAYVGVIAALWWPGLSVALAGGLVVGLLLVMSCASLVHFGPLAGTAAFGIAAALIAAFWFRMRGALLVVAFLVGWYALVGWANVRGLSHPVRANADLQDPLNWVRIASSLLVSGLGLAFLFGYIVQAFERGLVETVSARQRERAAEQERRRAAEALERSERLEGLGRLAGGIAHDFNNSLGVVLGATQMLQRSDLDEASRRALTEDILKAAHGAAQVTRQLLAFSRADVTTVGRSDPVEVVRRMGRTLGRLLPETIEVQLDVNPAPPVPLTDQALEQILLNLALNARDAMPSGGCLRIACRPEPDGKAVLIEVRDDGAGMDEATRARLFEPFFTTKPRGQGTGLGLASVHGRVSAIGGRIEVDSAPGEGTTLRLVLPVAEAPSARSPSLVTATPGSGTERILLVEDLDELRGVMTRALAEAGYQVVSASRTDEALELLEARSDGLDMLVTDGVLPGRPTHHLLDAFEARYPEAPILVCSGHVEEELIRSGIETGRFRLLSKPFGMDELTRQVRSLLDGEAA
ncbi:MAG: ATP-binding protein [Myxococcota bacterium]